MPTRWGYRWVGALAASMVGGLMIGMLHIMPAAADLSFTLDLDTCSIGCDVPGMRPSGTIVFKAADTGATNMQPNWQITDMAVSDREIATIVSQLMSNRTVVQDFYSGPYLTRGTVQQLVAAMPTSTAPSFTPQLPLTADPVSFVLPTSSITQSPTSITLSPRSVSEPTTLALLGAGLAAFAFLRRRRYV